MSAVVPMPAAAVPPYSECVRPDGSVGAYEPGPPSEIVPVVVPDYSDALLTIFLAFPTTEIISIE